MPKAVLKRGDWVEGKAGPELIAPQLRKLPEELVSKDVDDPDKVHDLDPPHILKGLLKDYGRQFTDEKPKTVKDETNKLRAPGPGERAPVVQWYVDVTKMRVIGSLINRAVAEFEAGLDPDLEAPLHLWFPNNNVNEYELRKGPPPPNSRRPKHLRRIDLRVDVLDPPKSIRAHLKTVGIDLEIDVMERMKQAEGNRATLLQ